MTDRAFDRAFEDWLASGSDRAPQPAVAAAIQRVARTSQERTLRLPWAASSRVGSRWVLALVAVLAASLLVAGIASVGGPSTVTTTPSPTSGPSASLGPEAQLEGPLWLLDFAASGLSDQPLTVDGGQVISLGAGLQFAAGNLEGDIGYGGGCGGFSAPYTADQSALRTTLTASGGGCDGGAASILRARLSRVASFRIGECGPSPSPSPVVWAFASGALVPAPASCRELRLFDQAGSSLLVFENRPRQ
jgi:hypothetical protein